jgi:hypothetical protein
VHGISFSPAAVSTLPVSREAGGIGSSAHVTGNGWESPPVPDSANSLPLRI